MESRACFNPNRTASSLFSCREECNRSFLLESTIGVGGSEGCILK